MHHALGRPRCTAVGSHGESRVYDLKTSPVLNGPAAHATSTHTGRGTDPPAYTLSLLPRRCRLRISKLAKARIHKPCGPAFLGSEPEQRSRISLFNSSMNLFSSPASTRMAP